MDIEEGIALMTKCFQKLKTILEDKLPYRISFTAEEYMAMHCAVYRLCSRGVDGDENSARFYDAYRAALSGYLSNAVAPSLSGHGGAGLLRELERSWLNHAVMTRWLSSLLSYLERCYISRASLPGLAKAGADCFRDEVYGRLKGAASEAVLALLERDRDGDEPPGRDLVKSVAVGVFVSAAGVRGYRADLEDKVVGATVEYYSRKAASWDVEACSYMARAEEALRRERERVRDFLHHSSEPAVVAAVREALLVAPSISARLLEDADSGFRALVRGGKTEDVKRLFRLYAETPHELDRAVALFRQHVVDEGMAVLVEGDSEDVIEKLIGLHNRYKDVYLRGCFDDHVLFRTALSAAFEKVANEKVDVKSTAELLANFCEDVLKKGGSCEKMSDEAVEETLESIVTLLSFVNDKDLFMELHRKKLSRRLLFGRSASLDHEKSLTAKLKRGFGHYYAMKLESMINDITIAKENDQDFERHHRGGVDVDFSVTVLTTNHWPSYKSADLAVPTEMAKCIEAYAGFYKSKFRERRLSFVYSLGTCNVRGQFGSKSIELVVSTYQGALLLLFNNNDRLSYLEIMAGLNMDSDDLARVLHSLSCAKYKVLKKTPSNGKVSESDVFEFNSEFDDPMRRIKIPLPPLAEHERKKVAQEVDKGREYAIDAAIVRVMKGRKVLTYQKLIIECIELLKHTFRPDMKMIKKRIDNLIDREFLARDEQDQNIFKYLA